MDRDEHRAWLKALTAENLRLRALAQPELARKDAELRTERLKLAASEAALHELETKLDAERQATEVADDV